jgi:hypothetical protein
MIGRLLAMTLAACTMGCKPAAPPENPLAAQRKVMKQASDLGDQLQQQSDQRLKSLDDTK